MGSDDGDEDAKKKKEQDALKARLAELKRLHEEMQRRRNKGQIEYDH
ncbi:hypothetical protein [Kibdelosporangium aridum]|uniref:Uncharacterized protein n=1 Tax=Kibdelosporangium aridum TaxID=2030 RepID=A0A1Y5XU88_KIBAR|nr:hypothetical protein [Kibdelosporangium aridum]SMD14539.1 hypothetical protein SAMN05661093_05064 [Kibdelosporangium aridum]